MQVCTSLQTDNHASTSPLCFYKLDALPAAQPTASKHWRQKDKHVKAKKRKIIGKAYDIYKQTIFVAAKSKIESRAYYAPEPARSQNLWQRKPTCFLTRREHAAASDCLALLATCECDCHGQTERLASYTDRSVTDDKATLTYHQSAQLCTPTDLSQAWKQR